MKKTWKGLILSLIVSVSFFGCEKYEEGGTLTKADKRITETLWKIQSAIDLEDGSDITSDYAGELWEFTTENEFKINSTLKGTYTFSADMLNLLITELDGGTDNYRIDRLDKEAMWLVEIGSEELNFIPN
ncbi:MAG: hypothetical protein ABFS32_20200 [Bacteroidota bacterium]